MQRKRFFPVEAKAPKALPKKCVCFSQFRYVCASPGISSAEFLSASILQASLLHVPPAPCLGESMGACFGQKLQATRLCPCHAWFGLMLNVLLAPVGTPTRILPHSTWHINDGCYDPPSRHAYCPTGRTSSLIAAPLGQRHREAAHCTEHCKR